MDAPSGASQNLNEPDGGGQMMPNPQPVPSALPQANSQSTINEPSTLPANIVAANPASAAQAPATADDSDLIEKEWVERAKAIVEGTRNDPYLQNKELNNFKADYMKKRYNKDIKVD